MKVFFHSGSSSGRTFHTNRIQKTFILVFFSPRCRKLSCGTRSVTNLYTSQNRNSGFRFYRLTSPSLYIFFYPWQYDTFHLERGGTMSLDFFRIFAGKICSHTWHINQDNGENSRQMFDFMFEFWRYGNLTENFCKWKLFTTPAEEEVAEKQHSFKSRFSSKIFVFL